MTRLALFLAGAPALSLNASRCLASAKVGRPTLEVLKDEDGRCNENPPNGAGLRIQEPHTPGFYP